MSEIMPSLYAQSRGLKPTIASIAARCGGGKSVPNPLQSTTRIATKKTTISTFIGVRLFRPPIK
ncbi:hypothetical protein AUG19_03400 [archaeon 13_1_20CM_2_54_9]|nr:MAG: hypothetical protein AUG19_03400 [archaeon 13_1_20CM_2_54_9]